jgi:methyl-accepting chemotaxis protein
MEANSEKDAVVQTGKKDFSVFELLKVPIFATDQGGKVVYGNEAFADMVGAKKEQLPGALVVKLIQSETSGMQRALATGDSTPVETWATIKDKQYFFEYRPTPSYDSKGVIRGVVETVVDRTGQKLALQAVRDLVDKAKDGDLSARASVRAEGDYQLLVDGINEMLDALVGPLNVAATYIDRISKGDIPEQITAEYHGDFNNIKNSLNTCIGEIGVLVDEVGVVIRLAREGDLAKRATPDRTKGVYRKILRGINDALDSLINPLNVAADYVDKIGKGEIPEQITAEYHGDFNNIKNNLNNCIGEIGVLVDEVGVVIRLAREGDLAKRANPDRAKGVYRKILRGINDALDSLINPLNVAADYVDKISKGDIPEKITAEYHGDFNNIKNNLNTCIEAVNGVVGEMGDLVSAASEGVLTKRGSASKFQGAYQEMVQGMNGLIDSIADPLADLTACLERMGVNDLTKKMPKDYLGVWNELKDATNSVLGQLVRVRETVIHLSDGNLSDLDEYRKIGRRSENDTLMPAFIKLMESIQLVIKETIGMTGAMTAGDLSDRADESKFQGAYRDIIHSLDALVDSVAAPVNELTGVLERMAVNDYTRKMLNNYSGVWAQLKQAVDLTLERVLHIEETTVKISNGDLDDLEAYRKIGKRSEKDQLVPAFTRMMEAIEALIEDTNVLAQAAVDGKLYTRADVARHQGEFRKVVAGVNGTLDAVLKPIKEASDCLQEMAKGNLDVAVKGDYRGDHAVIKENLNSTLDALNDILGQVTIAVDQVTNGAQQVSDSSQSLSQAATESASSLEQITASMHELTSQTGMNAENATQANQLAAQAKISAEKGEKQMGSMVKAMNDINQSASSISKIIKAIDEIAFQTNLLALNAAVEAARAGKHGKGFTVVAEEVRNLAQRSAAAAKETAEMIEGSIKKTEAGAKIAEETSKALEEIVTGSTKVTDLIGEIASASKEQAEGIGQINQGLSQVDQVTQQVTANSEESASASEELSSQSLQLKQMLDKFKLRKQGFNQIPGLPEGITPEMLQMLRRMLQSQQMAAASGMQSGRSGGRPPQKRGAGLRPSDVIALDDDDFGKF